MERPDGVISDLREVSARTSEGGGKVVLPVRSPRLCRQKGGS